MGIFRICLYFFAWWYAKSDNLFKIFIKTNAITCNYEVNHILSLWPDIMAYFDSGNQNRIYYIMIYLNMLYFVNTVFLGYAVFT